MDVLERLGNKIKKRRIELGLSQEALAFEAGLHRTYIGAVERGEKNVSIRSLKKIAVALKSNISFLTTGI
jgi:transcriptional regulator with XRE-family HTH domain